MKKIVKDCLKNGIIQENDFYRDDYYLMDKINRSINLKEQIGKIRVTEEQLIQKKRTVNPEILIDNRVMKLSEMI